LNIVVLPEFGLPARAIERLFRVICIFFGGYS
jgi:hypothetical protein